MKTLRKCLCFTLALAMIIIPIPITMTSCSVFGSKPLTLLENGQSDYIIVYPEKAGNLVTEAAEALRKAFDKKFDCRLFVEPDTPVEDENGEIIEWTTEILIGLTNRAESAAAMEAIGEDEYLIKTEGDRIVIVASDDAMLVKAVEFFIETYVTPATDVVEVAGDMLHKESAAGDPAAVQNADGSVTVKLDRFVVVYDDSCSQIFVPSVAKAFANRANELYGLVGATEDRTQNKYEILFGACKRTDYKTTDETFLFRDFYIAYANNKLSISAFSIYGYERAINFLLEGGFTDEGITIPAEGIYDAYNYGTGAYADLYRNYENPGLEGSWMVNVCHRGDVVTNKNPENSIPSYRSCLDNMVDVIETDLKKTKDGEWVICHDYSIDRTTNSSGKIADKTLAQLKTVKLRTQNGGAGSTVTQYTIPTLVEIIELCKGKCLFNLDHLSPSDFQEVYDIFEEQGAVEMAMFKTSEWMAQDLIKWFCSLIEDGRQLPLFSPLLYSDTLTNAMKFRGLTTMVETNRNHEPSTLKGIAAQGMRAMCLTALNPDLENVQFYASLQSVGYGAIMNDDPAQLKEFIHGK